MEAVILTPTFLLSALVVLIGGTGSFFAIKYGYKSKIDTNVVRINGLLAGLNSANSRVAHLDEHKQSTKVCTQFQKEMHYGITEITGTLKVIQADVSKTQVSVARLEGKMNGKT